MNNDSILFLPDKKKRLSWKYKYGLTSEQVLALYLKQNCGCGICKRPIQLISTTKPFGQSLPNDAAVIDHDHHKVRGESGFVRGLLCPLCNTILGSFVDSPAYLRSAASYLEETR